MMKILSEPLIISNWKDLIHIFSSKSDLVMLNSAKTMPEYGRYSYLCFDAFATFMAKEGDFFWNDEPIHLHCPFEFLKQKLNEFQLPKDLRLPPFQGGAVGYFGYEANHYLEQLPHVIDNIQLPDIYLNFYSSVIVQDHVTEECWIIATGFPEQQDDVRLQKAQQKINEIKQLILTEKCKINSIHKKVWVGPVASNFTKATYRNAVLKTQHYILNGEIFQANFTQQFNAPLPKEATPLHLYHQLISTNPAPFSAYVKLPQNKAIVSASPERFIKVTQGAVETCPIKGTRKRSSDPVEDLKLAKDLETSEKDRAENTMIVDLMRNDLSKVCKPHSIQVEALCALKSFETVHHLVSTITGELKDDLNVMDLLKATFPPGSVTGAPKIRAMEIISELEQQTRGPYCGCLGYFSFNGDMDTSVIIRTYYIKDQKIFFNAGGAVVLKSNAEEEYDESMIKAKALIDVLSQEHDFNY